MYYVLQSAYDARVLIERIETDRDQLRPSVNLISDTPDILTDKINKPLINLELQ